MLKTVGVDEVAHEELVVEPVLPVAKDPVVRTMNRLEHVEIADHEASEAVVGEEPDTAS